MDGFDELNTNKDTQKVGLMNQAPTLNQSPKNHFQIQNQA